MYEFGNVRVSLEWIGEGYWGDYEEGNVADNKLLRFYVSKKGPEGDFEDVEDASYCTQLHNLTEEQVVDVCKYIHGRVFASVKLGESIKKLGERLSWIQLDWLKED